MRVYRIPQCLLRLPRHSQSPRTGAAAKSTLYHSYVRLEQPRPVVPGTQTSQVKGWPQKYYTSSTSAQSILIVLSLRPPLLVNTCLVPHAHSSSPPGDPDGANRNQYQSCCARAGTTCCTCSIAYSWTIELTIASAEICSAWPGSFAK